MRNRTTPIPEEGTLHSPDRFDRAAVTGRRYTALVTLNKVCNLACPYCDMDGFGGRSCMGDAAADLLVEAILAGPFKEGREVRIDFQGGEPLLSLSLIGHIIGPLREASLRSGTLFSFNLVTNGTLLTRRLVDVLRPLGLAGVRVTIDGPPDVHNRQRPFADGTGSFDTIMDNLKEVCDLTAVRLGGYFTRDNYRRFPELLDMLGREGLTPDKLHGVQFSPVVPRTDGAGVGDLVAGCACGGEPWLVEASRYLREEILRRGWDASGPGVDAGAGESEHRPAAARDGSLCTCRDLTGRADPEIGTPFDSGDGRESRMVTPGRTQESLNAHVCGSGADFQAGCRAAAGVRLEA